MANPCGTVQIETKKNHELSISNQPITAFRLRNVRTAVIDDINLTVKAVYKDYEGAVRLAALQRLMSLNKFDDKWWKVILTTATDDEDAKMRSGVLDLLVNKYSSASETWPIVRTAALSDKNFTVRVNAMKLLLNTHKDVTEMEHFHREVLASVKNTDLFGSVFYAISCVVVENPIERQLLNRDFGYYVTGIDPNAPVTMQRVKSAASTLKQSEAKVYAHYENLAKTLSSKLEFDLKLDWNSASGK